MGHMKKEKGPCSSGKEKNEAAEVGGSVIGCQLVSARSGGEIEKKIFGFGGRLAP